MAKVKCTKIKERPIYIYQIQSGDKILEISAMEYSENDGLLHFHVENELIATLKTWEWIAKKIPADQMAEVISSLEL